MSFNSMLGAIARKGLPPLVLEEPRVENVEVHPSREGLRVEVQLAMLGLVPLGSARATARFTAVLQRRTSDGSTLRRSIASIESCDDIFRRRGLSLANASLLLSPPEAKRFGPRIGAHDGHEFELVDLAWTDLMITAPSHRITTRIRGEWRLAEKARDVYDFSID
ncbi:hypothetical protein GCM10027449_24960 [Sinomonas notoginsengisoli]|uniref:hypothetical protein n=1 Tax=Sinomonas notoginsengisoli TaxID=1457311 RepID=UPI001F30A766|nr:hypothetical protein [Sinomonas notoginsengisoli]